MIADYEVLGSLALLILLEIVLGIDNLVFISLLVSRLPAGQRTPARRIGLALALIARIALLTGTRTIMELTAPLFVFSGHAVSWRDLILGGGGIFLLYKAASEINEEVEGDRAHGSADAAAPPTLRRAIIQIVLLDLVFSIDSVITAVGTVDQIWVMIAAVIVAISVMLVVSASIAEFIGRHPSLKILALGFLLLIGTNLIAEATGFHIPKGYIYSAMTFAGFIEVVRLLAARRRHEQ